MISVEINPNFPVTIQASLLRNKPEFSWQLDKIQGVSAKAVYELGLKNGYSYVYHMSCTDIFLVRTDLLPLEFQGMKL